MAGPKPNGGHFQRFLHSAVSGSVVLLLCTVVAMLWANSVWAESYFALLHMHLGVAWGHGGVDLSLQHWVNDLIMVLFFFVVGLEIKRELLVGRLSTWRQAVLPVAAGVGGMVVPAGLYLMLNAGGPGARGWGVPMATDIAFSIGILALLGTRVPLSLKVFLTAFAIADDLGAVMVIALFYTETIRIGALVSAALFLILLFAFDRARFRRPWFFFLLAMGVWGSVFASGVHATVAGILVAFVMPVRSRIDPRDFMALTERKLAELRTTDLCADSVIEDKTQLRAVQEIHYAAGDVMPPGLALEEHLHPVQAFFVLPLFAFFNAGVAIDGSILETVVNPISLGIILGLFLGKPVGIWIISWIAIRLGWAELPPGVSWVHILGVGMLGGIGFTMSLFVSELAFTDTAAIDEAKIGILAASLLSAVAGYLLLFLTLPRAAR